MNNPISIKKYFFVLVSKNLVRNYIIMKKNVL